MWSRSTIRLKSRSQPCIYASTFLTSRRFLFSTGTKMQSAESGSSKTKKQSKNKTATSDDTPKDGKNSADKAYASSLLLPKTTFPIWIDSNVVKERYQERTTQELYKWQVSRFPLALNWFWYFAGEKSTRASICTARWTSVCQWQFTYWTCLEQDSEGRDSPVQHIARSESQVSLVLIIILEVWLGQELRSRLGLPWPPRRKQGFGEAKGPITFLYSWYKYWTGTRLSQTPWPQ